MITKQLEIGSSADRPAQATRSGAAWKPFLFAAVFVVAALSVCANVLLFYRWSDRRPVVTFDKGHSISKIEYEDALDDKDQGAVLKRLLFRAIVADAAAKAGLAPTAHEIDQRLAEVERESPQLLQGDGSDPNDALQNRADIAAAVALDKLRFRGIACSDAEAQAYYTEHKNEFLLPRQSVAVLVVTKDLVDNATAERLLRAGTKADVIADTPGLLVSGLNGFTLNMNALPQAATAQIEKAIYAMPVGAIKTFPIGPYFLSVRLQGREAEQLPSLAEVRDQVVRDVMNEKAPTLDEELAEIYQAAHVQFDVQKYDPYFDSIRTFDISDAGAKSDAQAP